MTLSVRGLHVSDGRRDVVAGVDLDIRPGQVTAVIGANGAGKSELVLALGGVLPARAGTVTLDGRLLNGLSPQAVRQAGVAAIPEGHRVLSALTVDDNLRAAGSPFGDVAARLSDVYVIFPELTDRKAQLAGTLSGGQQQMVALGHALMARPRYLLIDEMSLGLAPLVVKRLLGVVATLRDQGTGILLIEQFTDLALGMATDAVVLRTGQMRYQGPAAALAQDPDRLHQAYFGA